MQFSYKLQNTMGHTEVSVTIKVNEPLCMIATIHFKSTFTMNLVLAIRLSSCYLVITHSKQGKGNRNILCCRKSSKVEVSFVSTTLGVVYASVCDIVTFMACWDKTSLECEPQVTQHNSSKLHHQLCNHPIYMLHSLNAYFVKKINLFSV